MTVVFAFGLLLFAAVIWSVTLLLMTVLVGRDEGLRNPL
jgi:hypothetical protein